MGKQTTAPRCLINFLFTIKYCYKCKRRTKFIPSNTDIPRINQSQCPICKSYYQANFLESDMDIIQVDESLEIPSIEKIKQMNDEYLKEYIANIPNDLKGRKSYIESLKESHEFELNKLLSVLEKWNHL